MRAATAPGLPTPRVTSATVRRFGFYLKFRWHAKGSSIFADLFLISVLLGLEPPQSDDLGKLAIQVEGNVRC